MRILVRATVRRIVGFLSEFFGPIIVASEPRAVGRDIRHRPGRPDPRGALGAVAQSLEISRMTNRCC
jgi:hypothetical protein